MWKYPVFGGRMQISFTRSKSREPLGALEDGKNYHRHENALQALIGRARREVILKVCSQQSISVITATLSALMKTL